MAVKAKLSVVLKADDVEVAASEDGELWQQVLQAITGGRPLSAPNPSQAVGSAKADDVRSSLRVGDDPPRTDPLSRMAAAAGIEPNLLQGACNPTTDAPFIALDAHRYESMRKALPERGPKAIANIAIAGTLLAVWFHYSSQGNVTQAQAQAVLESLGKRDSNAPRGIRNADWLQPRSGGQFAVNPAEISKALIICRCFCTKDWAPFLELRDN